MNHAAKKKLKHKDTKNTKIAKVKKSMLKETGSVFVVLVIMVALC
jgi:hypothetical protein